MACLTADHFIGHEAAFRAVLAAAARVAEDNYLVTLGITPTYAATGYGYIQRGERLGEYDGQPAYRVMRFKEKPAQAEAEAMLADGQHAWNSGMFVWRVSRVMDEFRRQMPELHRVLAQVEADPASLARAWEAAPNTTIDYGLMEGAREVAVLPAADLGWNDIGSWDAVLDVLPGDAAGNVAIGAEHLAVETTGTLIHAERAGGPRLVATIGLNDVVIIDTEDALLVCPRSRAQEVKAVVEALKGRGDGHRHL
jgi:mannose-1-phosphate guanylyltransferase